MWFLTHFSLCGWLDVGITRFADNIVDAVQSTLGYTREVGGAVMGKITVDLPRATKIGRTLDQHGCRTECLPEKKKENNMHFYFYLFIFWCWGAKYFEVTLKVIMRWVKWNSASRSNWIFTFDFPATQREVQKCLNFFISTEIVVVSYCSIYFSENHSNR